MKNDYWIIAIALCVLAGLAGMMGINTVLGEREAELARREEELRQARGEVAGLQRQLIPPPYCPPLENMRITSGTGYRMNPLGGGTEALHHGEDASAEIGTPVRAALAGRVAEHWLPPGIHHGKRYSGHAQFGGYIVLDHGGGLLSKYGHLSKTLIHEGQWVGMGEKIAETGDTGISTGPHLHFELVVPPMEYLKMRRGK